MDHASKCKAIQLWENEKTATGWEEIFPNPVSDNVFPNPISDKRPVFSRYKNSQN